MGLGRIGQAVVKRAYPFGMNIIYHNRHRLSSAQEKKLHVKSVSLNELFTKSDVLSIHVPYTKETHQFVNMKLIKKMKQTSYVINTARGKIIKEKDLISALKQKIISGAALDVFEKEPAIGTKLAELDNVILTPHIGAQTKEAQSLAANVIAEKIVQILRGVI